MGLKKARETSPFAYLSNARQTCLMIAISRITTQYREIEDRITLTGEGADGHVYCSWLTQRLANRLLVNLFAILTPAEQDGLSSIVNEFSQEKAEAELTPQAPVKPADGASAHSLVQEIDINIADASVQLCFRHVEGQDVALTLTFRELRQWLSIVRRAYANADWPTEHWPNWLTERTPQATPPRLLN